MRILILLMTFVSLSLFAYSSSDELILKPILKPNQTYVYYFNKIITESNDGIIDSKDTSTSYKYFVVDDYNNEKFRITYKSEDLYNSEVLDKSTKDILSKFDLKDFSYEADKNGKYLGVIGWDSLSIIIRKVGSDMAEQSEYNSDTPQGNIFKYIVKKTLDYFSSTVGFEKAFLNETLNFHLAMGLKKDELEKQKVENIFIIPYGESVKGVSSIELSDNSESGKIELVKKTIIQDDELKKVLESLISLLIQDKRILKEFMDNSDISLIKETKITYSESSGIPLQIETIFDLTTKYPNKENKMSEKTLLKFKELLID